MAEQFADVEGYLDSLSVETRTALEQVRERIRATVPGSDVALAPYVSGKGTVKFPLSDPMPLDLVQRIVEALVDERD